MADAVAAQAPQVAEASPRTRKKLVMMLAALLVVGGIGGFLALKVLSAPASGAPVVEAPPVEGEVIDVAEMTASLSGKEPHLARVGFAVVLTEGADAAAVSARFALLKDAAVSELAASDADELITPAGVDDLRGRLSDRAAAIYPDGEVIRVVLTELVVQ